MKQYKVTMALGAGADKIVEADSVETQFGVVVFYVKEQSGHESWDYTHVVVLALANGTWLKIEKIELPQV